MNGILQNKKKIINDPVYGFINIPLESIYDIIEHPLFQRLRRIKQLGLTYYVYPGATHSRFQHVLGATHLMQMAIETLRNKGHEITNQEAEGVLQAILLHDIGHGPFSHTLENSFVKGISHEELSLLYMQLLNKEMNGKLELGIKIFENNYHKKFLHQLVSSQLDMDRLDYLRRDSFFTGVSEGVIGSDRIIKMLNINNDELVVDEKGIYSIEKFLIARRLMYWQVYLHKTVVAAEQILIRILQRAKQLVKNGHKLFTTPALAFFLRNDVNNIGYFHQKPDLLHLFAQLDDNDLITSIKIWSTHRDKTLSILCQNLINRQLFKIEIYANKKEINTNRIEAIKKITQKIYQLNENEINYFVFSDFISNKAYIRNIHDTINILKKNGKLKDIADASDISNVSALSKTVKKYFLCYPKVCLEKLNKKFM